MVTITLIEDPDGAQRQLFHDWAEVFAADGRHLFGADHTSWSADELRETGPQHRPAPDLAGRPSPTTGRSSAPPAWSCRSTTTWRRAGSSSWSTPTTGGAASARLLLEHAEAAARDHGRTLLLAETQWPVGGRDESGEEFAAAHGYAGAQTVLRSSLSLPADRARLEAASSADRGRHGRLRHADLLGRHTRGVVGGSRGAEPADEHRHPAR